MNQDRELVRAACRRHLYYFVRRAFETLHPGQAFIPAWHVEAMCHQLERVARGETLRLLITLPPRGLKSICASVCLTDWLLGHDPTLKILVASYGQDLAARHARDFRAIIESDWYRELFPKTRIDARRTREADIMTTKRGGRKSVSLGGAVTGFGADVMIVDDLMKAGEVHSEVKREDVKVFYEQTLHSRLDDKKTGRIIAIQQRLHEDDLAGYLIDKGTFEHLNLKAIAEEDERFELSQGRVHERRIGEALSPEREPLETLEQTRLEIGSFAFSAQYQQNPVPPGGNRLRWEWFGTYDECPARTYFQQVVQSWDTAVTAEPTSDFSVGTTWGYREGKWYLLDLYRARLDYPDLKRKVSELHRGWNADRVIIEHASTGIPLVHELSRDVRQSRRDRGDPFEYQGRTFISYRPTQDKEARFAAQTARLEEGIVVIPEQADWLAEFKNELLAFPNGRYDDQVDSVAQFLEWISSRRGESWLERHQNGGRPLGRPRPQGRRRR